jgi:hypothetical protein
MMRLMLLLFIVLLSGGHRLAAQENVEAQGITSVIKLEEVIFGHLAELNGKFKLRATEVTFAPEAYLGSASPRWPRDSVCAFRRGHLHRGRASDDL